ncbi:MAG TPA: DUF3568 family protein [Planctomycetaceae bacterium]|nr:DUF3568 family protein [Planctomycetaceae bacterium]
MRAIFVPLIGVAVCATAGGCLAVALGGGAVGAAYVLGDIDRTYAYPLDVVWSATHAALAELQLPPGFDSKDQLKAHFDRRTATGDRIRITLSSRGPVTKLSLRVNTFGDKSMSHVIVSRIESHLPGGTYDGPPEIGSAGPPEAGGPNLPRSLPLTDDDGPADE